MTNDIYAVRRYGRDEALPVCSAECGRLLFLVDSISQDLVELVVAVDPRGHMSGNVIGVWVDDSERVLQRWPGDYPSG